MTKTEKELALSDLKVGETARIEKSEVDRDLKRRLMELGFINGATVSCVGDSPLGDPRAYLVCSAIIAIRNKDGEKIICRRM